MTGEKVLGVALTECPTFFGEHVSRGSMWVGRFEGAPCLYQELGMQVGVLYLAAEWTPWRQNAASLPCGTAFSSHPQHSFCEASDREVPDKCTGYNFMQYPLQSRQQKLKLPFWCDPAL